MATRPYEISSPMAKDNLNSKTQRTPSTLPGGSFSEYCDNFDNSDHHRYDDIATQMYIANESDTTESDTKESDTKESDTTESDTKGSDTKESDTKGSDVNTETNYDSVGVSTDMHDDNDVSTSRKNVDVDESMDGVCTQMYHGPQTMLVVENGIESACSDIGTDNEATQMYCNAEYQIHVANETDANSNNDIYDDVATQLYANNDNCYDDVSTQLYAIESTDPNKVSTQGYSNTLQDNHVLPDDNSNKVNDETISESVAPIDAELDVETSSKSTVITEEPLVVVPIESTQKDEDVPVEICENGVFESTRASKKSRLSYFCFLNNALSYFSVINLIIVRPLSVSSFWF